DVFAKSEYVEPGTTPRMGWFPKGSLLAVAAFFVALVLLVRAAPSRSELEAKLRPAPSQLAMHVEPLGDPNERLPQDLTIRGSGNSPGKVVFSHANHIAMQEKVSCVVCHERTFGMGFAHSPRLQGEQWHQACGTCHDGKKASTSVNDETGESCSTCHQSQ
ncbi:MAG: cytochrome c3 family protein, partial [Armatimonadetes bacterium]|nr:cytochrome c3 family protein [Armatimonadota bacterium]